MAGGEMTAHEELRVLMQHYARAADARDVDALAALFHPDGQIDGVRGPQSVAAWLETMRAPRTHPVSMHLLADPLIEVEDGGHSATVDTYAVVFQIGDREAGPADLTLGIRYQDRAVRHEGRWVIRHRVSRTIWMR